MSSIFLCAKRNAIQIDEAQGVFILLWNAFAVVKDSDRIAVMPLPGRRIKERAGPWYQDGGPIIFGLKNTYSEGGVTHEPDQGSILGTRNGDTSRAGDKPTKSLFFLASEVPFSSVGIVVEGHLESMDICLGPGPKLGHLFKFNFFGTIYVERIDNWMDDDLSHRYDR